MHSPAESSADEPSADEATRLLLEVRKRILHWPEDFPGFRCALSLQESGLPAALGQLNLRSSREFDLEWDSPIDQGRDAWARDQVREFASHRESAAISRIVSEKPVALGASDPLRGTEIRFIGDPMESVYRIKDDRLVEIQRSYRGKLLTVCIDSFFEFEGASAAQSYSVFYADRETGRPSSTETYRDHFMLCAGIPLPQSRLFRLSEGARLTVRLLEFRDHSLL